MNPEHGGEKMVINCDLLVKTNQIKGWFNQ
jgi:hypothetical protein